MIFVIKIKNCTAHAIPNNVLNVIFSRFFLLLPYCNIPCCPCREAKVQVRRDCARHLVTALCCHPWQGQFHLPHSEMLVLEFIGRISETYLSSLITSDFSSLKSLRPLIFISLNSDDKLKILKSMDFMWIGSTGRIWSSGIPVSMNPLAFSRTLRRDLHIDYFDGRQLTENHRSSDRPRHQYIA